MDIFILTAGLNIGCANKIAARFTPPEYSLSQLSHVDGIHRIIGQRMPSIIIIGVGGCSTEDGLPHVRRIKSVDERLPIILISDASSEARVVAAFRGGVNDYFKKPVPHRQLCDSIARLLNSNAVSTSRVRRPTQSRLPDMIGDSDEMKGIRSYLLRIAAVQSTVLITGETGTGKELAAAMVHRYSRRHDKPFVYVNCAAFPESLAESELFGYDRGAFTGAVAKQQGKFVIANGGTIFLDEIGDMSPFIQAKILHAIERKVIYPLGGKKEIPLNVRVIAATNQEPEDLICSGRFRKDLYYRLNIARVNLPPLRKRKSDIPALVAHGIDRLNRRFGMRVEGVADDTMALLMRYDWPGNVRELLNLIEAAFISSPGRHIMSADLPVYFHQKVKPVETARKGERQIILSALSEAKWNKSHAAQKLQWSRMTLYRKMNKYRIGHKTANRRGPNSESLK